jgi:hypothetical protein
VTTTQLDVRDAALAEPLSLIDSLARSGVEDDFSRLVTMKKVQIETADLADLILAYREAARVQGNATETGRPKVGNTAATLICSIYSELRHRGAESQRALLPLLTDDDASVRLWAASHALEFSPRAAEHALQSLIEVGNLLSFCAQITLEEWRQGRLKFP